MNTSDVRDRLLAILAADVTGYSRLMSLDDRATVAALDAGRAVFREHIAAHNGRVVDMAGDSVLSVFETASGAVNAALAIQQQLSAIAADVPEERRMHFRIGIHIGDVIVKADGSVYGDGVNIAARLEGRAVPGAIAVSQAVHGVVARRVDAVFEDIGEQQVKNVEQPVRAFRLRLRLPGETAVAETPGTVEAPVRLGNLPEVLPALFGRDDDIGALRALIEDHRVVSIVGAGGIGKTRLALAVAHALRHVYPDGAWLVEFAPLSDPTLLPAAVAQALGITLAGNKSAQDQVIFALRGRALLLVLDNCEHVVDAASAFAAMVVERAPHARLLVTSQELLKIPQEHLYRVATLALPATTELAAARASGAVELLVSRVQALQPAFVLSEQNVADVVDICRRLDGLPLAIELAAARVPLLGAAGVRERLHERFRMLTGGARTALRRHQTLRETLEWSHGLLSAGERAVFRRAGVFAGGFTMAAAQQALADPNLDEWAVLEHLGALVDKSLVVAEATEPPRYRLLESARAYALEKLREAGETDATLELHAQAVLTGFEAGLAQRWTTPRTALLERHLPDLDNLRAALDWAAQGAADLHVALAGASSWIWASAGQRVEGLRRGETALARVGPSTQAALEARLQSEWADLAVKEPGLAPRAAAQRAIDLSRMLGDIPGLYTALGRLAICAALGSDASEGERATNEMTRHVDPGWPVLARWDWLLARAYVVYFDITHRFDEGRVVVDEIMRLATSAGDTHKVRTALMMQEQLAQSRGDFTEAVTRGRELVALARQDRFDGSGLTTYVGNLASALIQLGELDEARATAREATLLNDHAGSIWMILDPLALLACKRGRLDAAARVLGRAEAANRWRGGAREPTEQLARDEAMRRLRQALSDGDLERLLEEGAALSDEEVARIAVAD